MDPANAALKDGLAQAQQAQSQASASPFGNIFGPDMWVKIGMHPKLKEYLNDPTYVTALQGMQSNPGMMNMGGGGQVATVFVSLKAILQERLHSCFRRSFTTWPCGGEALRPVWFRPCGRGWGQPPALEIIAKTRGHFPWDCCVGGRAGAEV